MAHVRARDNESFDNLLKRFRKAVTKERVLSDVRKKRYFVSKSAKRHKALRKAIVRERRRQRKVEKRLGRY